MSRQMILLFAVAGFSGCHCGWEDRDLIESAVWADDDSEHLYVRHTFEERQSATPLPEAESVTRNHQLRVFRHGLDGTSTPVGDWREAAPGTDWYFMKSAGYILGSVRSGGDGVRYERWGLDGSVQPVVESPGTPDACTFSLVVPSPDGSTLAVVHRVGAPSSGPAIPGCGAGTVSLELLDAQSLSRVSLAPAVDINGRVQFTFAPDGRAFVFAGTDRFVLSGDGQSLEPTQDAPDCTFPSTTSSNTSSQGRLIAANTLSPEDPVVIVADGQPAFGCR